MVIAVGRGKDQFVSGVVEVCDDDRLRNLLAEVCDRTGMGFAAVARVTESRWVACQIEDRIDFGLSPGDELEVRMTICNELRHHMQAVVFDDAIDDPNWETHPVPIFYGFRSYASFPIILADGSFFGTLCALDPEPRSIVSAPVVAWLRDCSGRIAKVLSERIAASPAGELGSKIALSGD